MTLHFFFFLNQQSSNVVNVYFRLGITNLCHSSLYSSHCSYHKAYKTNCSHKLAIVTIGLFVKRSEITVLYMKEEI